MFSFIIIAFNQEKNISRCIKALKKINISKEIILVDDGSTDSTSEAGRKCGIDKIIRSEKNLGSSWAKNKGINVSQGKYLSILDADIEVIHFPTQKIIKLFENNPSLAGIIGKYYSSSNGFERALDLRRKIYFHKEDAEFNFNLDNYTTFSSGFSVLRKTAVKSFFEENSEMAGADLIWSMSLLKLDKNLYFKYLPSFIGIHHHPRGIKDMLKKAVSESNGYLCFTKRVIELNLTHPTINGFEVLSPLSYLGILSLNHVIALAFILFDILKFAIPIFTYRHKDLFKIKDVISLAIYSYLKSLYLIPYTLFFVFFTGLKIDLKLKILKRMIIDSLRLIKP